VLSVLLFAAALSQEPARPSFAEWLAGVRAEAIARAIDAIVPEPTDGAHTDADAAAVLLKDSIGESLDELAGFSADELRRRRRARFRSLGVLEPVKAP